MSPEPHVPPPTEPSAADRQLFDAAQAALLRDDLATARDGLRTLLDRHPGDWQLAMMLTGTLLGLDQLQVAAQCLLDVAPHLPPVPEVLAQVARRLTDLGESAAAAQCLDRAVPDHPRAAGGLAAMGAVWQVLGLPARSLELNERAARLGFDNAEQKYQRGLLLQFLGRADAARAQWQQALAQDPALGRACLSWARVAPEAERAALQASIARGEPRAEAGSVNAASFAFARFSDLDRHGEVAAAWAALHAGNELMAARLHHDPAAAAALIDATMALCTPQWVRSDTDAAPTGPQPIFIVGLPRSGTTLLERVLGNHSQVATPGELNDFWRQLRWTADRFGRSHLDPELLARLPGLDFTTVGARYLAQTQWRAGDKPRYVDKLPANVYLAGMLHKALPHARILNLAREPMAVGYSNYKAQFGDSYGYSYRLDHIAAQYCDYRRLMEHWQRVMPGVILDVPYRDLVEQPEATVRRVLEFCGLPYEAACLDIRHNRGPVMTLSTAQVREGIHTRALGEWQRYATQLEPLRLALGAWADRAD